MMRQDRLSASAVATIKKHARIIAHAPGDEFHCSATLAGDGDAGLSFYDIDTDIVMQLSYTGIFKRTGSTKRTDRGGPRVKTWTCPAEYRERAQAVLDSWDRPVGCGHTGVRNIPGGGYSCCDDDCNVEVPREEVEL